MYLILQLIVDFLCWFIYLRLGFVLKLFDFRSPQAAGSAEEIGLITDILWLDAG